MFGDMNKFETKELLWFQVTGLRSSNDTIRVYFR
jgi:hypothetical protein